MADEGASVNVLLRRACTGEAEALEELLRRYRDFVHLLVRSRGAGPLRGRLDSSDLVQETLMRAARHIRQFRGECEVAWRAWLARITEREVIRQWRRHLGAQKRDMGRERQAAQADSEGRSRLQAWGQCQSSPSQAVMREERAVQLAQVLAQLPEDYREVLVLRHLEGLPFEEVAQRLHRSPGAVRVLWTRALKKLRDELARFSGPTGSSHGGP